MNRRSGESRISPRWLALALVAVVAASAALCWATFQRAFTPYTSVTLTSDRAGLMMESGGKVKLRGVEVGRVGSVVSTGDQPVRIELQLSPSQLPYIPANVEAQITASTAFGAKFVDLVVPSNPSLSHLTAGAVLHSRNVSTEVNTVFDNLVTLLKQVDPAKLNSILSTFSEGLRDRGPQIASAITDANDVLSKLNSRSDAIDADWQALAGFSKTYSQAARNIIDFLDAASTTSTTVTSHAAELDSLLLNVIGLSNSGTSVLAADKDNLISMIRVLEPTTQLLLKYDPEYTCLLVGTKWYLDHAGYTGAGGNGHSVLVDAALLPGKDPYMYPDNLPIVAAKGGPGGKPGCGSLPDATKNFPVRYDVTNTGWGTGMDVRDNVGLGHPCWANYFPATRAAPEPVSVRCQGPPSPGLVLPPGPGAPPQPPHDDPAANPTVSQPSPDTDAPTTH